MLQEVLGADGNPLEDRHGTKMTRDIVQFVPLRNFNTQRADFSLVSSRNIRNYYLVTGSRDFDRDSHSVSILHEQERNQTQPSHDTTLSTAAATVISSCTEHSGTCTAQVNITKLNSHPILYHNLAVHNILLTTQQSTPYPSQPAPLSNSTDHKSNCTVSRGQSAPYPSQPTPYPATNPTGPQTTN